MTIEFDSLRVDDGGSDDGRGRRRVVAGVAAVTLIATAGGAGYGIGRGVDRDPSAADDGSNVAGADDPTAAATTTPVIVEEPSATLAPPSSRADVSDDMSDEAVDVAAGQAERGNTGLRSSGSPGSPAFGTQPMERLYERTTDSGFAFRVQLAQRWDEGLERDWRAGDWRPAPWCFEAGRLRVSMVGNGIVDIGGVPWYAEPFEGRAVSWLLLGGNDADLQWVVVVQTPADVTNVRVNFADGPSDQAAPQNGLAVLTAAVEPSTPVYEDEATYWMDPTPSFEVAFEGGAEPVTVSSTGAGPRESPQFRASCTPPPPALPYAGEQAADAATAEAEIPSPPGAYDDSSERSVVPATTVVLGD